MELKVWVEGMVRVVSGLSLNTSCRDVVIALAQAIGQTGRYILILKLRGNERQLVADDCPLQHLAQLGQLTTEVQFILRRTGPSFSEGQDTSTSKRHLPLTRPLESEPLKLREPQKALTFNLGPSKLPKRTKPKRDWSQSPRSSPEPRASPISFVDSTNSVKTNPSNEELFGQILQQQKILQDLEIQLQALEREKELWEWEWERSSPAVTLVEEVEELKWQLRQNEIELMQGENWEEELQAEIERERDMYRRLHQIDSSINDQSYEIGALQTRSAHLEEDLQVSAQRKSFWTSTPEQDEALRSLKQELHNRLQIGEELDVILTEIRLEIENAEERVKDRLEIIQELNKDLRQCNLQQFIQQTGVTSQTEQTNSLPVNDIYLNNAGIRK